MEIYITGLGVGTQTWSGNILYVITTLHNPFLIQFNYLYDSGAKLGPDQSISLYRISRGCNILVKSYPSLKCIIPTSNES